jgi:hypothetical protein
MNTKIVVAIIPTFIKYCHEIIKPGNKSYYIILS